jgi:ribosomal protein L11 methyltransferase
MNWAEVSIHTISEGIEAVSGFLMVHGVPSVQIEDAADFQSFLEDTTIYWDYVDDELMKLKDCETVVKFYLPDNPQGFEMLAGIRAALPSLPAQCGCPLGTLEITVSYQEEEAWETAWKKYYHPIVISDRLVIVPDWEQYPAREGQIQLRMNPGMAFGTGDHHTTRLCLELLDQRLQPGETVLDMGCGSGILSVAALLLGASSVTAVDIDELATRISHENAALNGVDDARLTVFCGNVLNDSTLADRLAARPADLITANIVADVIIGMAPLFPRCLKRNGTLLVSGIIGERAEEVYEALRMQGFSIEETHASSDWQAAVCRKRDIGKEN